MLLPSPPNHFDDRADAEWGDPVKVGISPNTERQDRDEAVRENLGQYGFLSAGYPLRTASVECRLLDDGHGRSAILRNL